MRDLYDRFQLVRVPIAKLEIANDKKLGGPILLERAHARPDEPPQPYSHGDKTEYHPPMIMETATGSLGWHVIDAKTMATVTIYRRQLSDEVLQLFDTPAQPSDA